MKIKIKYDRLPYQDEFHEATEFYDILSAGMGAGKTYSLVMKGLRLATINKNLPAGILAPDLKMFRRDVLPTFEQLGEEHKFNVKFRRADSELILPATGTKFLIFHAEDEGRSIRGPNLAFGLVNEVTLCDKPSFDAFAARIRLKQAILPQIAMSGTPEGFNWFYRDFIEKPRHDARVVYGDMTQNPHLPESYKQRLIEQFDPEAREAYVKGRFVNMKGKAVVHSFNRHKHGRKGIEVDRRWPVWIAVDFNVSPMAASIWQPRPNDQGRMCLFGVGEMNLRDSSTEALCRAIHVWLHENSATRFGEARPMADVAIFPDPAGAARSTKGFSDHSIMTEFGFKDLRFKKSIQSVRDCINALNAKFHRNEIFMDLEKMPETVADLEQCIWKDGTFEIDKRYGNRTHWLDGLKNMVDFEFPIGEGRGGWRRDAIR